MIYSSRYNSIIIKIIDFFSALISYIISINIWMLYVKNHNFNLTANKISIWLFLSFIVVILFNHFKAYSYKRFHSLSNEFKNVLKVSISVSLILVFYSFMTNDSELNRTFVLISFFTNLIVFGIQKSFLYLIANYIRKKGINRKKVLIIGTGTRAKNFIDVVNNNFQWGIDIIGLLSGDPEKINKNFYGYEVLGNIKDIEKILKEKNPEEVIFTISTKRFDTFREVFEVCEREGVIIRLNSDFFGKITKNVQVNNIFGLNFITFKTTNDDEFQHFLKRIIDILLSIVAIIIFAPFMTIAAIGIWLSDGRPILYTWNVVGKDKKPFKSWKFRTMVKNADEIKKELLLKNEMTGPVFKIKDDPRIIPFGRWLRKFSIDETPQLFSVLKGDMSLVGPRPAGPHELIHYESWQRRRLSVKPGLTCLWQVKGRNEIKSFDEWVKLDLYYIDNWSLWLDLKILLKTIPILLNGRGAS